MGQPVEFWSRLGQMVYARFDGGKNLSHLCLDLLSEQKREWIDLRNGYETLKKVRMREVACRDFSVFLQLNPGRLKSSIAHATDEPKTRPPCFLCPDHLPREQKGILYQGHFLILCNPMPVFPGHYVVSHVHHLSQSIEAYLTLFLALAADLGPDWIVLYNGPKCGASAPDHFHFQIIPSGQMPIEREMFQEKRRFPLKEMRGVFMDRIRSLGREVICLTGKAPGLLEDVFKKFLKSLKEVLQTDQEPMINLAGFHQGGQWYVLVFPRRKHRPDFFYKSGEERRVISPGAIDMGGFLVVPIERDFHQLHRSMIESIFEEVSLGERTVDEALHRMGS